MENLALSLTWKGHRIRMAGTPERPEWVAKDVCHALGIHHSAHALGRAGVLATERGSFEVHTLGGPQTMTTVVEAGLWKLVLTSRKPQAQQLKQWLVSDVIPSIREHGCYPPPATIVAAQLLDDQAIVDRAFLIVHGRVKQLEAENAVLRPKAEAHDRLSSAEGLVNLQEAGKATSLGPNSLQWRLIDEGVLFRGRHGKAEPKQEHVEAGRFVLKVREVEGRQFVQTLVTAKGLQWLVARYPKPAASTSLSLFKAS